MADQSAQAIRLPTPSDAPAAPAAAPVPAPAPAPAPSTTPQQDVVPATPDGVDTHSRDFAIGAGVIVVLMIAFFFAKNSYANMLVARKVAPRSANAAGWWLFLLLTSLALAVVFAAIDQEKFLTLIYMVPLAVIALVSVVLLVISSRR